MSTLIIQLLFLGLILYSLLAKKAKLFLLVVTIQILVYDVLSVYSDETLPRWIRWPAKGWQELIFVVALLQILIKRQSLPRWFLLFLVPASAGFAVALISSQIPGQIIQGFRIYLMLPLSLYLLMESRIFQHLPARIPAMVLLGFSFISVAYSVWQSAQFNGNLRLLWFYDFVDKIHPVELARFNYIREGGLRAPGFFISPLIQSAVLGLSALMAVGFLRNRNNSLTGYFIPGILFFVFMIGLYLCRTRIGWILFGGGLVSWYIMKLKTRFRKIGPFLVPGLLVFATFLLLLSGISADPSANGRIDQYSFLLCNLKFWGYGFGHPYTITYFDSLIISSIFLFGVFAIIYLLIPLLICTKLHSLNETFGNTRVDASFFLLPPFAAFSSIILYMMVFQFTIGGPAVNLYYWFAFIFISGLKIKNEPGQDNG
jgi:hypothetical protein